MVAERKCNQGSQPDIQRIEGIFTFISPSVWCLINRLKSGLSGITLSLGVKDRKKINLLAKEILNGCVLEWEV